MKYFTCVHDVPDVNELVALAKQLKQSTFSYSKPGSHKTLGLVFMNASLRTRLSTQKAAQQLGMNIISINASTEGWAIETNDGPMNGTTVEHIEEAAAVLGLYCDIIGVRCFPSLTDKTKDVNEKTLLQWMKHSGKPVLSLESATRHPLQSLADLLTIEEHKTTEKPKVVLTWAPHVKAVPHAVANSFAEWITKTNAEFVVACPEGMELDEQFTNGMPVIHDQQTALQNADFVYAKSWSSFRDYGKLHAGNEDWLLTRNKLSVTNNAKVMHCLPVRRDVELSTEVIKGKNSLILQQAENRVPAAMAVLKTMLASLESKKQVSKTELIHED
jgi:N-succinyl-L-ornithine transcarbamylase